MYFVGYPNHPPVATADSYSTNENTPLEVAAPGVLANDNDVDGNPLTAIKVTDPTNGRVTFNSDGSFTYTPALNYNGTDSFMYKANDGQVDSNIATVSITVTPPAILMLPSQTKAPTDPDSDGIYEDLNGNGRLDFADVVLYFNQMTWIAANEPIAAFDLNGNGRIDFADIVALFNEI